MDENKIVKISKLTEQNKEKPEEKTKASSFSVHTNPIIQKMLFFNILNKKDKFKFRDLFR